MEKHSLPYKISTLLYIRNSRGELLLLERLKEPNFGLWSPIGGKLEMPIGESPFEAARREAQEEIGLELADHDLHLFAMVAEKNYEFRTHWLMFLFNCHKTVDVLPKAFDEGRFAFIPENQLDQLNIPDTDRKALWALYQNHREGFVSIRADCRPDRPLQVITEQLIAHQSGK